MNPGGSYFCFMDTAETSMSSNMKDNYAGFRERLAALLMDAVIPWIGTALLGNLFDVRADRAFMRDVHL